MANYEPDKPGVAGAVVTPHAAVSSDTFTNNGKVMVRVTNGGGSSTNVDFDDPNSTSPIAAIQFNPDARVAVGAGATKIIGPFPPNRFNDANGRVTITFSVTTSVTWEAYATE